LTEEVVESAERRADVLGIVHAQSEYMPATMTNNLQDIHQQLNTLPEIRQELRDLNIRVKTAQAETPNALIRLRNRFIFPEAISAVQKTVPGSGLVLARTQAPDQVTETAINDFADQNPEFANADIGSIPAFFNATIDGYQHLDCLKLTLFYNEDMGIVPGSGLVDRRGAIMKWLNTF